MASNILKYTIPLTLVKITGPLELRPALLSESLIVPVAVPLLRQSSLPKVPSLALKNRIPLALINSTGSEFPDPELISLTITVPA